MQAILLYQIRALGARILAMFSTVLNSIATDFDSKVDRTEMQSYIKTIETDANGITFKDGNGNVVCRINKL